MNAGRWLVTAASLSAVAVAAPYAVAAWLSPGAGSAFANATVVNRATAPQVTGQGAKAVVSWSAATLGTGDAVEGYRVLRHVGSTVTTVCTVAHPATTCDDTSPVGGSVQYGVAAYRGSWTGAESPLTTFVFDTTAPTTTLSRNPAGTDASWAGQNVAVTLDATDASSGVKQIHYTVNGGTEQVVSAATTTFTVSREDANALQFWAVDNAGNVEATKSATVRVDKTAPVSSATLSSTSTPTGGWYTANVTVSLGVTDTSPVGGVAAGVTGSEYQLNGGAWTSGTSVTVSAEGTTTVGYRSTDAAGNVETAKSVTVRIDRTGPAFAPAVTAGTAGSNGWFKGSTAPVVKLGASDAGSGASSVQYQVGGTSGTWLTYDDSTGIAVPESASHAIYYRATDAVGNTTTAGPFTVKYDKTAPTASHTIAPATPDGSAGWYRTRPTVTVTASDVLSGLDTIAWLINAIAGVGSPSTTSPASFQLPDGNDTVSWTATDKAGNTSTAAPVYKVDTSAPTVAITDPVTGQSYANGNNGSSSWSRVCTTGKICASVTDAASGIDGASASYKLVGTSNTNNGKCWNGTAWVTGSACSVAMTFSGATGATSGTLAGGDIARTSMLTGGYSVTVTVKDVAGNTVTSSAVAFTTS